VGYLHISNLYRPEAQIILLFREVYAMEKVHGTSAHIRWHNNTVTYSSGGESHERFRQLFDDAALTQAFTLLGHDDVTVYGEAYGGKCQGMRETYGNELRFIGFDVKVGDIWLTVPNMADVCEKLGVEVVPYRKVSTDLAALDAERDRPSEVAVRRGIMTPRPREGVVLRPLQEFTTSNGNRVIVNSPPWHDGAWEQLVGRWFRSGQSKNVEVIVPITWMSSPSGRVSLDMLRLSRINDRGNIADAVVDGALPTHVGGLGELVAAAKAELEKLG